MHIQTKPVSKMDFLEISKNLVFSATRCCKSDVCDLRSLIEDACGDDDHEDQDGHDIDQDDDPNDGHYDQDLPPTTLMVGWRLFHCPETLNPNLRFPKEE